MKLLHWRYCNISNNHNLDFKTLNKLAEDICKLNIKGFSFQQTEDLCFLSGSVFRLLQEGKTEIELLNRLGQKRILLNQVIGSDFGEYVSTYDLLSSIQQREPKRDLFEQYSEFLQNFRTSSGGKIVLIYLDLLTNQMNSNMARLEGNELEVINQIVVKYLNREPFKISSIHFSILEQTKEKIKNLKSKKLNSKILSILDILEE